jgi:transketolase
MVHEALIAATALGSEGVSAAVINISTIKPLDDETVINYCRGRKLVVTVEEHGIVGGLGGAVAELKATLDGMPRQLFIGLPDRFGKIGDYAFLLQKYGLTGVAIAGRIAAELGVVMAPQERYS